MQILRFDAAEDCVWQLMARSVSGYGGRQARMATASSGGKDSNKKNNKRYEVEPYSI